MGDGRRPKQEAGKAKGGPGKRRKGGKLRSRPVSRSGATQGGKFILAKKAKKKKRKK